MAKKVERYQHAPEDWDVICEKCGTKWDFVDDRAVCPCCGDTLNKVEIATLKEEAYIRRRKKQLAQEQAEKEEQERIAKEKQQTKMIISWVVFTAIVIGIVVLFTMFK